MMKKGLITLNLLIILSSLLLLTLFLTDDLLTNYSAILVQRKNYIKEDLSLQIKSYQQRKAHCENLSLDLVDDQKILAFNQNELTQLTHFIGCKRQSLFRKLPTKKKVENLSEFIADDIEFFRAKFSVIPAILNTDKNARLYWITAEQKEIQLDGNINAVIIAESDLTIVGKGKIRGAIIINGQVHMEDKIDLSYNKDVITSLHKQYSRWLLAEKSWYDFNPVPL